jgi:lysozyme
MIELPPVVFDGVIDVSHHNGAIDWPAVAEAGIVLAFVKATQGTRFIDPKFRRNRGDAVKAGILVVPYHFLDTADPDRQAEHFLDVAELEAGQPGMLDWETAAPADAAVAFGAALVDCSGRDPVAYYGYSQLLEADASLSGWPLMLPAYPRGSRPGDYRTLVHRPPRLPPGRAASWAGAQLPYHFHQYTPAGRGSGIAGPVDRSVWTGTPAGLRAWFAAGTLPGDPVA